MIRTSQPPSSFFSNPPNFGQQFRPVVNITGVEGREIIECSEVNFKQLIYLRSCCHSTFRVPRTAKIIIENCKRCVFIITAVPVSGTLEIIGSEDLQVKIEEEIPTITIDTSARCVVEFNPATCSIPRFFWSSCSELSAVVHNQEYEIPPELSLNPAGEQNATINQYRSLWDPSISSFLTELIIREGAGYPTTQREKNIADERERRNLARLSQLASRPRFPRNMI
eukprot:TRINITY_DN5827_c0_g1_i1.p1 TRINITY_DN5827_c0_g1~~TRINITY_DN5827_c0_g1_i1.p1  ORF type:complete len:225 (+),score=45.90 TRINITY_DN5827_c0_g1_i1:36-710(+)